jgi:hypothetical protein
MLLFCHFLIYTYKEILIADLACMKRRKQMSSLSKTLLIHLLEQKALTVRMHIGNTLSGEKLAFCGPMRTWIC